MKVYLNSANENWIVDRQKEWWYKHCPETTPESVVELDIVWLIAPWLWKLQIPEMLESKKVVCTIHHVNESEPGKFDKADFDARDKIVDHYLVPNKFTEAFVKKHTNKPIKLIPYFYESKIWVREDKSFRDEFRLNENDFVVGSFQRDTEGKDLKSPKLEKGPDLFCDHVEKLKEIYKEKLVVLLAGWRRQYVINRLEKAGIRYEYLEMADQPTLSKMYQCCDLYVLSSRFEGGAQALLECSQLKVPIVSTDCGMASVVLNKNCVFDVTKKTYIPTKFDIEENYKRVQLFDIKNLKKEYLDFFEEVCK